jgi:hypothetical protein
VSHLPVGSNVSFSTHCRHAVCRALLGFGSEEWKRGRAGGHRIGDGVGPLIAEWEIDKKIGFIVSDEEPGNFQISLFVFPHDGPDYAYSRKQTFRTIPLELLLFALEEARDRLRSLKDRKG